MENYIQHKALILKSSELKGTFVGTKISDGLLVLDDNKNYGYFKSEPIYIGEFNSLVFSWKLAAAKIPNNTPDICISVSYDLGEDEYSDFYSAGLWSIKTGISSSHSLSDDNGNINTDTFFAYASSTQVVLKVELFANDVESTNTCGLEYIAITGDFETNEAPLTDTDKVFIDVPCRSQMAVPKIGNVICSPTSVAMVLEYYGTNLPTTTVAHGVYDNGAQIYGNWSFNTAYAASLGFNAYVDTFDLDTLKYTLSCGVPVICSIATSDKTQLEGSPMAYPSGHLVVACGYEQIGNTTYITFNDPAAPTDETVRRQYRADQFVRVWNGIVYIITKS